MEIVIFLLKSLSIFCPDYFLKKSLLRTKQAVGWDRNIFTMLVLCYLVFAANNFKSHPCFFMEYAMIIIQLALDQISVGLLQLVFPFAHVLYIVLNNAKCRMKLLLEINFK